MNPGSGISLPGSQLSALSEHMVLRYFNFIAPYVARAIPVGMMFFGIPAWVAMSRIASPFNNLNLFIWVAFVVNCFGAPPDIATNSIAAEHFFQSFFKLIKQ